MNITAAYQLTESIALGQLTIGPEGRPLPPEGKLLTMVVNGVEMDPVPGEYTGDIRLGLRTTSPPPLRECTPSPRIPRSPTGPPCC